MKLWKNTNTLDNLVPELNSSCDPSEAEVAVIGGKNFNINDLPNLKGIFKCGVGVDNLPFAEAENHSIEICLPSEETKNYIFEETANFTTQLVFKSMFSKIGDVKEWIKEPREFLGRKKILVLGLGNIGKHVVRKLEPSFEILTFDPLFNETKELKDLMEISDLVSIHMPLNDATRSFIDKEKLSWMKDGAILINTARGPIVEEEALYNEISKGRLKAAFDVFWEEPYQGRLSQFHPSSFLMSPHVASNCKDFLEGLAKDLYFFLDKLNSTA